MKRLAAIGVAAFAVAALAAQTAERVDADAIAKIREEGLKRSQVMEHMFWLTDAYGPQAHRFARVRAGGRLDRKDS